jgi:hypothetical protein
LASPFKLLSESGLVRRNLIVFALITAALNGMVTATVGAWLAQTYAAHQARRQSVQGIADLIYERRARGGMVVSSLRRGAEADELRYRKRAYDEVFVEWNKKVQTNILQIREVMGVAEASVFEGLMQDLLVPVLATMDGCLTKGYDVRIAGQDPLPVIEGCRYAVLHQFALDCAAGFTDELYRVTNLKFLAFRRSSEREVALGSARVRGVCTLPPEAAKPAAAGTSEAGPAAVQGVPQPPSQSPDAARFPSSAPSPKGN